MAFEPSIGFLLTAWPHHRLCAQVPDVFQHRRAGRSPSPPPASVGTRLRRRPVESREELGSKNASFLENLAARIASAFYLSMLHLGTGDALAVGACCRSLSTAVEGGQAIEVSFDPLSHLFGPLVGFRWSLGRSRWVRGASGRGGRG